MGSNASKERHMGAKKEARGRVSIISTTVAEGGRKVGYMKQWSGRGWSGVNQN
jgi:hypothetical protein